MCSNCCRSCSFDPEILKIRQSYHKMYSNNILDFQKSKTILDACTKKSGNLLKAPRIFVCSYLIRFAKLWHKAGYLERPLSSHLSLSKQIFGTAK